ncbi:rtm1 [Hyphodiscus hymeniophilus]|uniref:Rtm1 n=1 Tax=Hyphodiscus hymeniophilus TaxID=353542 RepID=A0A9P6VHG4_9HELO|nr:rtm1 [Hyphodiscus hymeniophilus]
MAAESDFRYYHYNPSLAAAAIFTVLFSLTSLLHLYQLIRARTWYFIPLVVGAIFEVIGYIARIISSNQSPNWTLGPFIIQSITLLVAPALFAASIYMVLGRIIVAIDGEKFSLIRKKWLTKIFVTSDVFSFLVLSSGAGILSGKNGNNQSLGQDIILAGLVIQIIGFGIFVFVALLFHKRMFKNPTPVSLQSDMPWEKHLYTLYFVSLLIMVRSLIRVIEYIQGNDGYILGHEVFLYIFDGTLMFIVVAVFNGIHPSELIPGRKKISHERDVSMEPL